MRIRQRFLLHLLIFQGITLVLTVGAQYASHRVFTRNLYGSIVEIFDANVGSFTTSIDYLDQLSVTILSDPAIQEFLQSATDEKSDFVRGQERTRLLQQLSFYVRSNPYVQEVLIADPSGRFYQPNVGAFYPSYYSGVTDAGLTAAVSELSGSPLWTGTASAALPAILSREINVVGEVRRRSIGQLHIFVDISRLLGETLAQIEAYRVDTLITHFDQPFFRSAGMALDDARTRLGSRRYAVLAVDGTRYVVAGIATRDTQWDFLFLIPAGPLFRDIDAISQVLYATIAVVFAVFTILAVRLTTRIANPVMSLAALMKRIEDRGFSIDASIAAPANSSTEVATLYQEFNHLIGRIDTLVNKTLRQELDLRKAQLDTLTGQLDPHFLYNTLDSIYWMAEVNGQRELATMTKSLSALLRSSLTHRDSMITIKEQLDLLNAYFYIQKTRLKERLEYVIDVDPELYGTEIPRFTLQPIVENSIKYSFADEHASCRIEILIQRLESESGLLIRVRDDGPGMSGSADVPHGTGIGLGNLRQRFRLIYGDRASLSIDSEGHMGTDLVIRLPLSANSDDGPDEGAP